MCDKAVLNEVTERVCAAAKEVLGDKLRKIILYGSYARGDYDEYSDIDILVLADIAQEECCDAGVEIYDHVWEFELEHDVIINPHVTGCAVFQKYSETLPFYIDVVKEGVELYAA